MTEERVAKLLKYWRDVAELADQHHAESATGSHGEAYWRGYAEAYREVIRKVEAEGDATRALAAFGVAEEDEITVRID